MLLRRLAKGILVSYLVGVLLVSGATPAKAMTVFDPSVFAQSVLTVAAMAKEYALDIIRYLEEQSTNMNIQFGNFSKLVADKLTLKTQAKMGDIAAVNQQASDQRQANGRIAADVARSKASSACATAAATAAKSNAEYMLMQSLGRALRRGGLMKNAGSGAAAPNSPAAAAQEIKSSCDYGFISKDRYGTVLLTKMGCNTSDPQYPDADVSIESILNNLQIPLPVDSEIGTKGLKVNITNVKEKKFAAAVSFCQMLDPNKSQPPNFEGAAAVTLTVQDVMNVYEDRKLLATLSGPYAQCLDALLYRVSCPAGSKDVLKDGNGKTCHDYQVGMCQFLRDGQQRPDGGTTGYHMSFKGFNPEYQNALAKCDSDGLSLAMYDALMANRCSDAGYLKDLKEKIPEDDKYNEAIEFRCPQERREWFRRSELEKQNLINSVNALINLRMVPMGAGGRQPVVK